jgi:GR25 family glycosyltransferase involved in LPS biosynthesis
MSKTINNISDIKHTFYINLEYRVDRKIHVEKQLNNIGIISFERFNAINLPNGRLGCSMSHLKCLEHAKKSGWDHILIVEDDILFLDPILFQKQLNTFLSTHKNWDVLLIGGNVVPPYQPIDSSCIKVKKTQTTTGYIVRSHYYDILIENICAGMNLLMKEPGNHILYAIDKYWFQLQEKDSWYLIIPLSVTQREDYSDIEKRNTNYSMVMTDLNKPWFKR